MNRTLLQHVRIVDGSVRPGNLLLENGKILAVLPERCEVAADTVMDCGGLYASAGLIEMHTHGAGGQFNGRAGDRKLFDIRFPS